MSTNIVFTVPGRNQNYMPIDINTTKEDILEKYARYYLLNFFIQKISYRNITFWRLRVKSEPKFIPIFLLNQIIPKKTVHTVLA
jgi:hypothetical protein